MVYIHTSVQIQRTVDSVNLRDEMRWNKKSIVWINGAQSNIRDSLFLIDSYGPDVIST